MELRPANRHLAWVLLIALSSSLGCSQPEEHPPAEQRAAPPLEALPAPQFVAGTGGSSSIADVTARVVPSVVNIFATKVHRSATDRHMLPFFNDPFFREFFGAPGPQRPQERRERSLGSGVIVSEDGIILTNNHVVQSAEEIKVTLNDGRDLAAKLVGTDAKSDLAVLRIVGDVGKLKALPFGDSNRLRLGDVVLAVGNPFGVGQTVTMGIVSATGRANVGIVDYEDFIQTDAAINPGNSGGALVDLEGGLVGINTAILSRTGGYQGIGFAIPSNMARPIMESLLEHGRVVRGWLGVSIQDVDDDLAGAMNLDVEQGVLIADVTDESPADRAGLRRGDVIVQVDREPLRSSARLRNLVALRGAGNEVTLDVMRDGERKKIVVTLGELPGEFAGEPGDLHITELSGLTLTALSPAVRQRYRISPRVKQGVVVTEVAANTPAQRVGIQPGDIIIEVNRTPVSSVEQVQRAYARSRTRLLLWVQRGNLRTFVVLPKNGKD